MRWHYRDAGLLWLFVPAYVLHVCEEWVGGFPTWIAAFAGRPLPIDAFVAINGVGLALLVVGVWRATRSQRSGWVAVAVAVIALVNTLSHMFGAAVTGTYSPGLITAVVLYVPLGCLTMIRAVDQAPRRQVTVGVAAGVAIHALVFVLAFTFARVGT